MLHSFFVFLGFFLAELKTPQFTSEIFLTFSNCLMISVWPFLAAQLRGVYPAGSGLGWGFILVWKLFLLSSISWLIVIVCICDADSRLSSGVSTIPYCNKQFRFVKSFLLTASITSLRTVDLLWHISEKQNYLYGHFDGLKKELCTFNCLINGPARLFISEMFTFITDCPFFLAKL